MRMSRKRRRDFAPVKAAREAEEAARLAELAARPTRLLRKETRALRLGRTLEAAERAAMRRLLAGRAHRLERRGRRRMQRDEALRQTAMAASVSTLALLPAGEAAASGMSTMHDVPAAFQSMRDARDRIRSFHAAQDAVANAKEALEQAEAALQSARQDARNAEQGLVQARENLETARRNLERLVRELAAARVESEQLTQEALASQQAVADYLPQIQAQESSISSLAQDQAQVQADYQQMFGSEAAAEGQEARGQYHDFLADSITKAWESVDWQQNRLAEVQAQITGLLQSGAASAGTVQQPGSTDQREAFVQRLEEIDAQLDAEEAALDEMYGYLDELEAAREAAEDAESDARSRVEDLAQEQTDTEADIRQQETDLGETEKWREEAVQNLAEAERYETEAVAELAEAEHDLEHFGEGTSWQSSFDYYNWHSYHFGGHQVVLGQSFFASEKNIDYGLDTNYVVSRSGLPKGGVSGWTDTTLFAAIKNDHPKYDVHYTFNVNVPTGKETHVNAQLPEGLARFTSFGEGWNFTPGVEVTRHLSETDRLTGRLMYSMRGKYDYRSDYELPPVAGMGIEPTLIAAKGRIHPGNQLQTQLEYLHAGDKEQAMVQAGYSYTGESEQRVRLPLLHTTAYRSRYRDGFNGWLRAFYSQDVTKHDSWQIFASASYTARTHYMRREYDSHINTNIIWWEGGLGWTHEFDPRQRLSLMFTYQKAEGNVYLTSIRDSYNPDGELHWHNPSRKALTLDYTYRLDESSQVEFRLERYDIHDHGDDNLKFHGWGGAVMFTKSI